MQLWHASPLALSTIKADSYWAADPDVALDFGMEWENRGAWLYSVETTNQNDWIYAGVIDEDMGGTVRMYKNKVDVTPTSSDWIDWMDHYGWRPSYAQFKYALQAYDDPIVAELGKILRKVNNASAALQRNLIDQTKTWAGNLATTADQTQQAYSEDWNRYGELLGDLMEISGNLRDLDESKHQQPERWIEFLEDLYIKAADLELQADEANYPETHPAFKLVRKIEEQLNMELD